MPRKQVSTSQAVCLPAERIERSILMIRGERVMLDADLAELYGVETRALVQAVKRNAERFPPDFAFEVTPEEFNILRSQIVISRWGGRRYLPYAFTKHGIAILSSVLRSPRAVRANIEIMRAFIRLRQMLASHQDLAKRLDELEQRYDAQFKTVFDAIRALMTTPDKPHRSIGFRVEEAAAYEKRRVPRSIVFSASPSPLFGGEGGVEGETMAAPRLTAVSVPRSLRLK